MDRQSLAGFFDELDKVGQFGGDIDDLYAAPNSSIVPTLKRVHNIGKMKGSSWADIGPVGQREGRAASYPKLPWVRDKTKQAASFGLPPKIEDGYLVQTVGGTGYKHTVSGVPRGSLRKNWKEKDSQGRTWHWQEARTPLDLAKKVRHRNEYIDEALWGLEKSAEPPPPPGVTAEQWDKILSRKSKSKEMATKLAYKLQGHDSVQGLRIAIENRKGSVRKGTDSDGNEWSTKMVHPYGYLVGTKGADGEPVDCYVGPDKEAPAAFVVHQHKDDGKGYDEDKVMLGFRTKKEAKEAYLKHYDDPKFLGPVSKVSVERLRNLVKSKRKLSKIAQAQEQEPGKVTRFLRKAGPGLGGAAGLGIGALLGARRGRLLQGALAGLGAGATLGWVPDMAHGVREGVQELR